MSSIANPARQPAARVSRPWTQRTADLAGRMAASLALIGAVTFFFFRMVRVNATTVGFFYLVAILMIATVWGLVESTTASIAAMLCLNYFFLPPVGTLTIADPQNWVALFAFLITSLIASQLSASAKRRTLEAVDRQGEIERLYALSRSLLLTDTNRSMAHQIVREIARTFEFPAVALYDRNNDAIYRAAPDDMHEIDSHMREAARQSSEFRDDRARLIITPIRLGGQPIGSLAIRGASLSDAALQSLLNLVAIGMERALSQEAVNRAEVSRQSEELKSTLLDAIAHEFKTPLTSIKAVTTDLLSNPEEELQQHQRELVSIADEGADRLSKLVTEAIQLARIEGGTFRLNRGMHLPGVLIASAAKQMKSVTEGREVRLGAASDLPPVWVDAELIQMVITHLIDNALKYSRAGTPIEIGARASEGKVLVHVTDRGAGITKDEQARIFEKFYRGRRERNLKGTGMGLAIAREILRAHGEEIWVLSKPGEGSEFRFSLPVAARSSAE